MKNLYKFRMALTLVVMIAGMATALAQTNPITVDTRDLYKQGTNVADPAGAPATAADEDPDLVTIGTKVPYLVVPDIDLNPDWVATSPTSNLVSTWKWTLPVGLSSTFNAVTSTTNYIMVDVDGATGTTGAITVQEQNGATCAGTSTTLNVEVIAKPTVTALAVSNGSAAPDPITSICTSATNTTLNLSLPTFTVTRSTSGKIPGNPLVRVKASLVFTDHLGNSTTLVPAGTVLNVDETTGAVSNTDLTNAATAASQSYDDLDNWGTYTLLVTHVSDKISRKDTNAAGGYFDVNNDGDATNGFSATYTVYKAPATGKIYHLPNN